MGSDFKKLFNNLEERDKSKASSDIPKTLPKKARPTGKRSNPDYTQVSAYIPKDLHKRVKIALVNSDQDFSELVSQLLEEWLNDK